MIYGLVLMLQQAEIERYCFGECGNVIIGGIDTDVAGPLVPCKRDECLHEEATTPVMGTSALTGEEIKIRKLKPVKEPEIPISEFLVHMEASE